jgi:hypothetical protein
MVKGLITAVVLGTNPTEPDHPVQLSRPLFLDTGGIDGHQARTRRQIDKLKAAREKLAEDDPKRAVYGTRQRRARQLAQLAQQHHDPCRHLAHPQVQKPSLRPALPLRASTRHVAYLPSLWEAC